MFSFWVLLLTHCYFFFFKNERVACCVRVFCVRLSRSWRGALPCPALREALLQNPAVPAQPALAPSAPWSSRRAGLRPSQRHWRTTRVSGNTVGRPTFTVGVPVAQRTQPGLCSPARSLLPVLPARRHLRAQGSDLRGWALCVGCGGHREVCRTGHNCTPRREEDRGEGLVVKSREEVAGESEQRVGTTLSVCPQVRPSCH